MQLSDDVKTRRQMLLLAVGAFVVVFILWQLAADTNLLYPFRLIVTFVHEAGHGLSAILTGGRFVRFEVLPGGAGLATTAGGNAFIVFQMGYLGAALFGAALLFITNRVRRVNLVAFVVGLFFLGCALLFTGSGGSTLIAGAVIAVLLWVVSEAVESRSARSALLFKLGAGTALLVTLVIVWGNVALMTGISAGLALFALAALAAPVLVYFVLNVVALIVGFNALNDIIGLWNNQSARLGNTPNDALALANLTNTPVGFWIILWVLLALAMMAAAAYFGVIRPARR